MGYHPDVVANGLEVLAAVHRQTYDVILMDVQMPEMDGLEASRRIIQEFDAGRRPRLIALTANVFKSDRDACLAAGMDGFLGKPLDLAQLQEALLQCHGVAEPGKTLRDSNRCILASMLVTAACSRRAQLSAPDSVAAPAAVQQPPAQAPRTGEGLAGAVDDVKRLEVDSHDARFDALTACCASGVCRSRSKPSPSRSAEREPRTEGRNIVVTLGQGPRGGGTPQTTMTT